MADNRLQIGRVTPVTSSNPSNGRHFHHVLPQRYPAFLGNVLAMSALYKAKLNPYREPRAPFMDVALQAAYGEGRGGGVRLEDWPETNRNLTPSQYLKLVLKLDHRDDPVMRQIIATKGAIDPAAIGSQTSGAPFIGFLGVPGWQRADDPGSAPDKVPLSMQPILPSALFATLKNLLDTTSQGVIAQPNARDVPILISAFSHDSLVALTEDLVKRQDRISGVAHMSQPGDWRLPNDTPFVILKEKVLWTPQLRPAEIELALREDSSDGVGGREVPVAAAAGPRDRIFQWALPASATDAPQSTGPKARSDKSAEGMLIEVTR